MNSRIAKATFLTTLFLVVLLTVLLAAAKVRLMYRHHGEGVFLLQGTKGAWLELSDDVLLGEEHRVLCGLSFNRTCVSGQTAEDPVDGEVFLEYRWNAADGYGFVVNHLGEGRILLTNLSRYIDSNNQITHGLFVGGGRPESLRPDSLWRGNDTGMAYFDGQRWSHIWCNTNEGIGSVALGNNFAPSAWDFLGSHVEKATEQALVLVSRHAVNIDGVPLQMERRATFVAGQPYFDLSISLKNIGRTPGRYYYLYSDEPWLGNYGGSAGDIGWVAGRFVHYEEVIDPRLYSSAGMIDYGNTAIGEGPQSRVANFIEWRGLNRPDTVFFANQFDGFGHPASMLVPLSGDARSLGLYWGPKLILPGEQQVMNLTVGMAQIDAVSGYPHKPIVTSPSTPPPRFRKPAARKIS